MLANKIFAVALFSVLLIGLFIFVRKFTPQNPGDYDKQPPQPSKEEKLIRKIRTEISTMTLEQKIGQMLLLNFSGQILSGETVNWLRDHSIGGIILLGGNIDSFGQTKDLIRELKLRAGDGKYPLFIAVDQEGGEISRFKFLNELTPQKKIINEQQAFNVAKERGRELRELGANVNFSPVLDIISSTDEFMYNRTFNGDETIVADLGRAMIRGYRESGIVGVAKHFPGHGDILVDSHKNLPILTRDEAAFAKHIFPFVRAIEEKVEMIMVGHLKIENIDSVYPASISFKFIKELLRDKIGYKGVVITDDLGMGAITKQFSLPEAAVSAIKAGADIVLVVSNQKNHALIYEAIRNSVLNGEIPIERVNQSVERILILKEKLETIES